MEGSEALTIAVTMGAMADRDQSQDYDQKVRRRPVEQWEPAVRTSSPARCHSHVGPAHSV